MSTNVEVIAQPTHQWTEVGVQSLQADKAALREARIKQCWEFYNAEKRGLTEFLLNNLLVEDYRKAVPAALEHLTKNFHRFGGRTRGEFLAWAAKRLRNLPELKHYATLRDFLMVGIEDFEKTSKADLDSFTYTRHDAPFGPEYQVPIPTKDGPVIWRLRDLDFARGLWPVVVKKTTSGKLYIAKVIQNHVVPVHRLFFRLDPHDVVRSHDGDYTNMSMHPLSQQVSVFMGDWEKPDEKSKSKLVPAKGTKILHTELRQSWVPNLYIAHDRWGAPNTQADERQEKFEGTRMSQPIEAQTEDGDKVMLEFGGWSEGTVSCQDVVRATLEGKNTPATWRKLDREDKRESAGVQHDMTVATIRDTNRDKDRAMDGDVAGLLEQARLPAPDRPSLVEDVEVLEAEMEKALEREPKYLSPRFGVFSTS